MDGLKNAWNGFIGRGAELIDRLPGVQRAHAAGKWMARTQERIKAEFTGLKPDQGRATDFKDTQLDHTVRLIRKGPEANADRFEQSEREDWAPYKPAQRAA
ncbi:MAG: hypothetical protein AMXMBFR33_57420 [Candidatus Xenobia bacterium]|jgi:hypothetical protein